MDHFQFYQRINLKRIPDYAFIIHARSLNDLKNNFPEIRGLSDNAIRQVCLRSRPQVLGDIQRAGDNTYGIFIGAFFDPKALFVDKTQVQSEQELKTAKQKAAEHLLHARKSLLAAGDLAGKLGCKFVGLGALTAAFTGYGAKYSQNGYQVTTGHCMTAATICENLKTVVRNTKTTNLTITVLGAAGSMGKLVARRLIEGERHKLLLVDRDDKHADLCDYYSPYLNNRIELRPRHSYLKESNIVVSVTNAAKTLIDPHDRESLKPGAILLDDAQPWCWDRDSAVRRFNHDNDILPLEAGLLSGNGQPFITGTLDHGLPGDTVFSCLAETYLLSRHPDKLQPTLGLIDKDGQEFIDSSKQFGHIAAQSGISAAPWRAGPHLLEQSRVNTFFKRYWRNRTLNLNGNSIT